MHEDVRFVSAAELAREVRGRELPPIEVVGASSERTEDRNQKADAYVTTPGDGVREAAVSAERAPYSGGELDPPRDVPHGVMDFSDHKAGVESAYGSKPLAAYVPAGMQLVGRRFDEATMFAACVAFERTGPWYGSYPPRPKQTSGTDPQKNGKRG